MLKCVFVHSVEKLPITACLCLGWSAMQQVVTLHPDATVIMSIVVSVPLSHVWPDCRRESEDLRTCQNFGFAQFCTIM